MLEELFRLYNQIIIITGATGLLGRKHAEAIACYGGTPILSDLSQDIIDDFSNELNAKYNTNAMCPGCVENGQPEEFLKEVNARIPMSRMASSNEYQGTLLWMLSDASSYLNGAIIPVEGGRTAW